MALTWKGKACVSILLAGLFVALVFLIHWYVVATAPPYVTVSLLSGGGSTSTTGAAELRWSSTSPSASCTSTSPSR